MVGTLGKFDRCFDPPLGVGRKLHHYDEAAGILLAGPADDQLQDLTHLLLVLPRI